MRYFIDTEFIEKPCTIDLISIGIAAENGDEFYAEATDVDWTQASPWVLENVQPHLWADKFLPGRASEDNLCLYAGPKRRIGEQIYSWIHNRTRWPGGKLDSTNAYDAKEHVDEDAPKFWAYYGDYDWVAFCWLFGTMLELPAGWPKFCRDLRQYQEENHVLGLPDPIGIEHSALWDARWTRIATFFVDKEKAWHQMVDAAHDGN